MRSAMSFCPCSVFRYFSSSGLLMKPISTRTAGRNTFTSTMNPAPPAPEARLDLEPFERGYLRLAVLAVFRDDFVFTPCDGLVLFAFRVAEHIHAVPFCLILARTVHGVAVQADEQVAVPFVREVRAFPEFDEHVRFASELHIEAFLGERLLELFPDGERDVLLLADLSDGAGILAAVSGVDDYRAHFACPRALALDDELFSAADDAGFAAEDELAFAAALEL